MLFSFREIHDKDLPNRPIVPGSPHVSRSVQVFSWISGPVRCLGGRHERSEKHIRSSTDDKHVSICRFCRTPMKRRAKRDWIAISRSEYRDLAR